MPKLGVDDTETLLRNYLKAAIAGTLPGGGSTLTDTDELDEGVVNLYYTDQRVEDYLVAPGPIGLTAPNTGAFSTLSVDGKTIVLAGNFTTVGAFTLSLTLTANSALIAPTTGTLAVLPVISALAYNAALAPVLAGNGARTIINVGTLTANVTSVAAPITGTPVDGQLLEFRFVQNATGGWTVTGWNAIYKESSSLLLASIPATASKRCKVLFEYDAVDAAWHLVSITGAY